MQGVLLVNKPQGITSFAVIAKLRKIFGIKKIGHAGTLDPMATGLLPVFFQDSTKFIQYALNADKCYEATVKLGETTTTADALGDILQTRQVQVTSALINEAAKSLLGQIKMCPPAFSALKHKGRPLYAYAREGKTVDLTIKEREVTIFELQVTSIDLVKHTFDIKVHCSKGTYIRSIAELLGEKLGCGAHLIKLNRTKVKNLDLANAIPLDEITRDHFSLTPIETILTDFDSLYLSSYEEAEKLFFGQKINLNRDLKEGVFQLYWKDHFLGLGELEQQEISVVRLINQNSFLALTD